MPSPTCAACGKSITADALQHGGRTYCDACASLIVTPGSLPAVDPEAALEVVQEFKISIRAPDVRSPFAVPESQQMRAIEMPAQTGPEVDLIEGAGNDMANAHDEDDWFKPRNSGGAATADAGSAPKIVVKPAPTPAPAPAPVANRVAAKGSGVSSRVGMPPAKKPVGPPSARMNAVPPPQIEPEAEAPVAEVQPRKSASARISAVKSGSSVNMKPAAKGGSRRMSAVHAPAAPAPAPEPEVTEESEAEVVSASPSTGKSSRRMLAAKSSSRTSASRSKREEREEKDAKGKKKGAGKKDDKMPIYIGVGVVAVLLLGAFAIKGGGSGDGAETKQVKKEEVDKTPSGLYAQKAQSSLSSGSRKDAVQFYTLAAQQAEREGNTDKARNYNMKAMDLIKTSKLSDR